jgi:ketosteroid isomerase-like protein
MWFDPASGRLLRTDDASNAPAGERAVRWLGLLHVGTFGGGWVVTLLWSAGSVALVLLVVTGYVMWWKKGTLRAMMRAPTVALVVALSGFSAACGGPAPVNEADVVAPLEAFYAAMKTGDTAAAMRPIAADALFVESGKLETRAEYEMNHLPADIDFERQITGKRSPWQVKTNGDTAWVIATTEYDGTVDGAPVNFVSGQLAVLTRANDEWQIRSIHWSSRRR